MSHMRRKAIHFTDDERVYKVVVQASPDVVVQLKACLGSIVADAYGEVVLTVYDAAKAAQWAGDFSHITSPDHSATNAIYECLAYGVFNLLWENGTYGALAGESSW